MVQSMFQNNRVTGHQYERGFTFIELLLVLTVVSMMSFIVFPLGKQWIEQELTEQAMKELVASIYEMQAYAIAHEQTMRLDFRQSGSIYVVSSIEMGEIDRITLPEGIRFISSSSLHRVEFLPSGDLRASGTLSFRTSSGVVELRLQLVRGRVLVYG